MGIDAVSNGPLDSSGSGKMRGGLLIALFEDHGAVPGTDDDPGDDGHVEARSLASSGLKWLLRFVSALVVGAPSVGVATKSATSGISVQRSSSCTPSSPARPDSVSPAWTTDEGVRSTIRAM